MPRDYKVYLEDILDIPEAIRAEHPDIPWKRVAGLRDILIHDVITTKLSPLEARVSQMLAE
jgi:uncharacterized protein with HEPN domain